RLAMGWVLGGALGNLVDRVFYDGLVVDFLDFGLGAHRFWAFNVADMGVTCGGLLLMASLLVKDGRESHD
ncbi:MAG: signal peptidase II, partial [Candidatus Krumholzibacteria bacterium]|nr:signal peptidase II [Candidatus Krumholzibacteria bacterium]